MRGPPGSRQRALVLPGGRGRGGGIPGLPALPPVPGPALDLLPDGARAALPRGPAHRGRSPGWTEDDLGASLGVSARHLRRLFVEHLGLTPDQLARSTRVHFARRLLDDTDLTFADIAFASGFGSVRQFNRACHDVFRATPGELRARRRVRDRLVADGGIALRLPLQPPFDWQAMLGWMQSRCITGVEDVSGGCYRRTVVIDGDPGVLEIGPGGQDHLVLHAHLPHWRGLIHVVQRARDIFNLDADTGTADRDLGADPLTGPLIRDRPGIRPPGAWDPFEAGIEAIAGGEASQAETAEIIGRIVQRYGTPVAGLSAFGLSHAFPQPAALAGADLRGLGLGPSSSRAVRAFAQAVTEGLLKLSRENRWHMLSGTVSGMSAEIASRFALRLGERDAFPCASPELLRALARAAGHAVTPQQAEGIAERWRPWRAHATVQLLLSSQDLPGPSPSASCRHASAACGPLRAVLPARPLHGA